MNKRYKLKKDLPIFKAGERFGIDPEGHLRSLESFHEYKTLGQSIGILAYTKSTLNRFPNILKDWFEEIPERPKTVDNLEGAMRCWVIGDDAIWESEWCNIVGAVDKRSVGRIALTEEEARRELRRLKAKVIIERDAKGFKPDWKRGRSGWEVYWKCGKLIANDYPFQDGAIRFATREDAEASIKAHEKEWKIYLGVED